MKYNIPAKATMYKGRLYRSRLEARWAAMFDAMGWQYEYEPFDLEGWSPDFKIKGVYLDILVEVKPQYLINDSLIEKIKNVLNPDFPFHILILDENPFIEDKSWDSIKLGTGIQTGKLYDPVSCEFSGKYNHEYTTDFQMKCRNDFSTMEGGWDGMILGKIDRKQFLCVGDDDTIWLQKQWQQTGNKTMFLKPEVK